MTMYIEVYELISDVKIVIDDEVYERHNEINNKYYGNTHTLIKGSTNRRILFFCYEKLENKHKKT